MKIFVILFLSIFASFAYSFDNNSGIKLSLNTNYAKLLERLDVSKFANGKNIVSEPKKIDVNSQISLNIRNVTIDSIQMPDLVEVNSSQISEKDGTTDILLKNIQINLIVSFDINVWIFNDSINNGSIKVKINSISSQYHFENGHVKFNKLSVDINDIDIKFNSFLYKTIYWVAKKLIINQINSAAEKSRADIENAVNKFIDEETILKVPVVSLFFNATSTEAPHLYFDKSLVTYHPSHIDFSLKNHSPQFINFLAENHELEINYSAFSSNNNPFLEFGISGYMFEDKERKIDYRPVEMNFSNRKGVNILLSDFTINSLLYVFQISGKIAFRFDKNFHKEGYPDMTTDGLSAYIKELKVKYPNSKDLKLSVAVPPLAPIQPKLNTSESSMEITIIFKVEINVIESDDPFDDPVTSLSADLKTIFIVNPSVNDSKISLVVKNSSIQEIININTNLDQFNQEAFKTNFNDFIKLIVRSEINPLVQNLDINSLNLPFLIYNINFDVKNGYSYIGLDVTKKIN